MWIRKFQRDRKKGVDSPMPTQVLSNEEFIPRPQSKKQKEVEYLIDDPIGPCTRSVDFVDHKDGMQPALEGLLGNKSRLWHGTVDRVDHQ